ncbi:hypothetical protein [Streptomyces sp. Ag82_O1-15]|uniref:hypothetical protein n=1 Tax=Streptomyces sp. Ag82_O1-15 TaxID=1938855 RepID=UPI0015CEE01A|nr:hypothetical protein [Streptomyces sp. Ag82_O1-15]
MFRGIFMDTVGRFSQAEPLLNLLGVILAGTLTLPTQKWLWAQHRERTAKAAGQA